MAIRIIMTAMEWIWRLIWLNFIWIIFSIPIVTIIPSTFAMFAVANKWLKDDHDIEIFSSFVKSFKRLFFKSFLLGVPILILGLFLSFDLIILLRQTGGLFLVVQYSIMVIALFYLLILFYVIPIFIQFEFPFTKLFIVSFIMTLRQPVVTVIMLCGILAVFVVFTFWTGIGLLFIGSTTALFATKAAFMGFKKYGLEV